MSEPAHEPPRPPSVDSPATATADEELLVVLADEFAARLRRGEQPSVEEYANRHPPLAERIRKVFQAVTSIEQSRTIDYSAVAERVGAMVGRYKLLERIGEGGFGIVYMAEQQQPVRRKVALKVVKPGMDSRQVLARFEAERQALAIMDHPNIARVFDGGMTDSGRPYFVMELVKGEPITAFCDRNQLSPRQRLELFAQVCNAVQHAHQKGIIHRDIKPTNVLVALHDTAPAVKVIDFGVAKALGQELTEKTLFTGFAQLLGTPLYMSPEQAGESSLDIDTRSDIYSLGVLLYELLTGTTPFDKDRFKQAAKDEIFRIIREEEPPTPSTRLGESKDSLPSIAAQRHTEPAKLAKLVRGELDWIVMKALEKDRTRRYETANSFAADVERYLADEPVLACPPSLSYRVRKFARRNKAALAVTLLVLVSLMLLGTGIGWVMRDRTERQARVAGQVELILNEVEELQKQQKWREALVAGRRAEVALTSGEPDSTTEQRVRERLKELEFVDRLERISMQSEIDPETDRKYAQAFRDYGVDIEELAAEASIKRFKARASLAIPIAAALDNWVYFLLKERESDAARWKPWVTIARGIDPDPLRDRLRSTCGRPVTETREELRGLAASIEVRAQHPATLVCLVQTLRYSELPDSARRILRDAQFAYPNDFWFNSTLAHELAAQGDFEGAVRFYTAAVSLRPYSAVAYFNLGVTSSRQDKLDEAIAAYRKALELDPSNYAASVNFASILAAQGKIDEAVAAYRKVTETHPASFQAQYFLGNYLRDHGKQDEANVAFDRAIEIARETVEREPTSEQYVVLGDVLIAKGKFDDAVDAYRKAIDLDPKNAIAYGHLANRVLRTRWNRDEAIAAYRKAISADPTKSGEFRRLLGKALQEWGMFDEAVSVFQEASEVDPKDARPYHLLGLCLRDQGKRNEAIAAFQKSVELAPDASVYIDLGKALIDEKKLDQAIAAYQRAIELDRKALDVKSINAELARVSKSIDVDVLLGRDDFKKLITTIENAFSPNDLAWLLVTTPVAGLRDPKRAVTLAEKAVAENPYSADFWNTLGVAQYRAGTWKDAISSLERYRELRLGDARSSNFFLAMAEWQLGHKDAANEWYQKSVAWMEANASTDEEVIGLYVEAEKLMGGISGQSLSAARERRWVRELAGLSRDVEQIPADAEPYHARGIRLCQIGRVREAIADFDKALAIKPGDHQLWYEAAVVYLYAGDVERYHGACRALLDRFEKLAEEDPEIADRTAKVCALAPDSTPDFTLVEKLAERCITGTENHRSHRNFMFAKGLAEYRSTHDAQALHWLRRYAPADEVHPWNASAHATLAMVRHRLGQSDEAIASLEAARAILAKKPADTINNHEWFEWLHCEILCREAENILAK